MTRGEFYDTGEIMHDANKPAVHPGCALCFHNGLFDMPVLGYVAGLQGGIAARATVRDGRGGFVKLIEHQFVAIPFTHAVTFSALPRDWLATVEELFGMVCKIIYGCEWLPHNIVFNDGADAGETVGSHKHAQIRVRIHEVGLRSYRLGAASAIGVLNALS